METVIKIENLCKEFHDQQRGTVKAVDNLNLECFGGEVFGLLGPNGAGKTTTLRMISTLMKPNGGKITVNGYQTSTNPDQVRQSIGYMSTTTSLYPKLTPREILTYFASLNNYPKDQIKERVEVVISSLKIGDYADTLIEKLSTGMKQITSYARSIVHNPPVLILDEPSLGLDVMVAVKMHTFINEMRESGKSIIFSSHNMGEVEKMCDRIGVINKGKLLAVGTLSQLRDLTGKHYMEDIFVDLVKREEY